MLARWPRMQAAEQYWLFRIIDDAVVTVPARAARRDAIRSFEPYVLAGPNADFQDPARGDSPPQAPAEPVEHEPLRDSREEVVGPGSAVVPAARAIRFAIHAIPHPASLRAFGDSHLNYPCEAVWRDGT